MKIRKYSQIIQLASLGYLSGYNFAYLIFSISGWYLFVRQSKEQ